MAEEFHYARQAHAVAQQLGSIGVTQSMWIDVLFDAVFPGHLLESFSQPRSVARAAANYGGLASDKYLGKVDVLALRGILLPKVGLNEALAAPGPFDKGRFIGPYAEFAFIIDVDSLGPGEEEADDREP